MITWARVLCFRCSLILSTRDDVKANDAKQDTEEHNEYRGLYVDIVTKQELQNKWEVLTIVEIG